MNDFKEEWVVLFFIGIHDTHIAEGDLGEDRIKGRTPYKFLLDPFFGSGAVCPGIDGRHSFSHIFLDHAGGH